MDTRNSFWFVLAFAAAWPLILVGLFAFNRRFPTGIPVQKRWWLWAALAPVYLAAAAYFFVTGLSLRGFSFLALAISAAAYALDQRRRSNMSGNVGSQRT